MSSLLRIYSLSNLRSLGRDCSGATTIENSLIIALVSLAVISGVSEVGAFVFDIFDKTADTIEQACDGGPGNGNGNCTNTGNGGGNNNGSGTGTGNNGANNGQSNN